MVIVMSEFIQFDRLLGKDSIGDYVPIIEYYLVDQDDNILVDHHGIPIGALNGKYENTRIRY